MGLRDPQAGNGRARLQIQKEAPIPNHPIPFPGVKGIVEKTSLCYPSQPAFLASGLVQLVLCLPVVIKSGRLCLF